MSQLRYPAVPLIAVDPYFSVWSCADKLYDDVTRHWTGSRQNMLGILTVDGEHYRFMGKIHADNLYPYEPEVLPQTSVLVKPMQTVYTFENEAVRLTLTFMTPLLPDDLKLMSRPVSYISYRVEAKDGKAHETELYLGLSAELAVNKAEQCVTVREYEHGICCGRGDQDVLAVSGDDQRIDWGWLHLFDDGTHTIGVSDLPELLSRFGVGGSAGGRQKKVGAEKECFSYLSADRKFRLEKDAVCGLVCAAYDDLHSIMYFHKPIDAYYKKDGDTFETVCKKALSEYETICARVEKAEAELLEKATKISPKYADILALAYRQAIAAHKLTWDGEEIQFLSKECFSNGCIGTLDVTYPSIPLFLLCNPTLVEGMMNPIFKYAATDAWPFEFAPHDVGQYPIANGQVYGLNRETMELGLESQMPVEECGNALLCVYASCHYKKDFKYFIKNQAILKKWADYLTEYGVDPENQLCTDDFAGHLAHNCNLSAKAIMGIAAFGKMEEAVGAPEEGARYLEIAKKFVTQWEKMAFDGDHYRLAFDRPDTWSIKYNLVWDKIYGWNLFSPAVYDAEVAYYKTKFNPYGLPLDNRSDYTKSDWLLWSVRLKEDAEYTAQIVETMWDMLNESPSRVPFSDWYFTSTAKQRGFQNRTVQGGLFIALL